MNRKTIIKATWFLTLFVIVCCVASAASACPTCKDGVAANDPEHVGMVKGYFYSILFMMGTPYVVITCFGLYMWRQVKLARTRNAKETLGSNSSCAPSVTPQSESAHIRVRSALAEELVEV